MQQLIKKTEPRFKNSNSNSKFSLLNIKIRRNTLPTDLKKKIAVIIDDILEDYMILRENELDTRGL